MHFGIGTNTDRTLEEVGKAFSVTRERIGQIEVKALRKLKHASRARQLRSLAALRAASKGPSFKDGGGDDRPRHPRPHRAQRLPHRPQGRVPAEAKQAAAPGRHRRQPGSPGLTSGVHGRLRRRPGRLGWETQRVNRIAAWSAVAETASRSGLSAIRCACGRRSGAGTGGTHDKSGAVPAIIGYTCRPELRDWADALRQGFHRAAESASTWVTSITPSRTDSALRERTCCWICGARAISRMPLR